MTSLTGHPQEGFLLVTALTHLGRRGRVSSLFRDRGHGSRGRA